MGLTTLTSEPLTVTCPRPVIVPEPWKVVMLPEDALVAVPAVVTNVPEIVPFSASTLLDTGGETGGKVCTKAAGATPE